jgi:hypothetical protein
MSKRKKNKKTTNETTKQERVWKKVTQDEFYQSIVGHKVVSIEQTGDERYPSICIKLDNGIELVGEASDWCCGFSEFNLENTGDLDAIVADYKIENIFDAPPRVDRADKVTLFATNKRTVAEILECGVDGSWGYDRPEYVIREIREVKEDE